ncbi:universal stress protein [Natronolimnohabitans sp. A-GB9]|uniref:universal stress protein n=1 Tax=Natronolimnohabitans sp. A-GB9 TaxID=3069757 RepID=UPI0027B1192D|nr:universal stress protein [Natronolimnohabitans sp. A-GB9]MDQ2049018.1 universal stress protein [Natronolimnohabitans sp. A-GB9]
MYDTILVPTDGSEQAARGVEHGLNLAAQHDASVVCLYVVDERRHGRPPALGSVEAEHEKVEDDALDMLEGIADRARERDLEVACECCRGLPWEEIIAHADREDADLIVMGRRGATDDRRTPLGSVAERVIRQAEIPVQAV